MKYTLIFFSIAAYCSLFTSFGSPVLAYEEESGETGKLSFHDITRDTRTDKLRLYFTEQNSPLTGVASQFIYYADKYNLDWKLVAAIAGTESAFGKHIPVGSYNAWGWGIPTGAQSGVGFKNWENGIAAVSDGLRNNYINKGARTIQQIGHTYAASPNWEISVRYFLNQIEQFTPNRPGLIEVTL